MYFISNTAAREAGSFRPPSLLRSRFYKWERQNLSFGRPPICTLHLTYVYTAAALSVNHWPSS